MYILTGFSKDPSEGFLPFCEHSMDADKLVQSGKSRIANEYADSTTQWAIDLKGHDAQFEIKTTETYRDGDTFYSYRFFVRIYKDDFKTFEVKFLASLSGRFYAQSSKSNIWLDNKGGGFLEITIGYFTIYEI